MQVNFEITCDREFLKHFWNHREIFKFSPELVEKLRSSDDPYGRYGYGQWLYRVRPDGDESLKEAYKCFEYASDNGVADAKQMLSYMMYIGDVYNEEKCIWEKSNIKALILNAQAQEEGSELACLRKNRDLFWGNIVPARRDAAIAEALEKMEVSDAPLLWLAQLGEFYEVEGRKQEAIEAYEKCIEGGLYYPLYDLALLYISDGDNWKYDALMQEGIEKGVADSFAWGMEHEGIWEALPAERRKELHERMEANMLKGIELGGSFCAYLLAYSKFEGSFGFEKDLEGALTAAQKGVAMHSHLCCNMVLDIMSLEDVRNEIPEDKILSDEEFALMYLKSARYGDDSKIETILECEDYVNLGYGEEMKELAHWYRMKAKQASEEVNEEPQEEVEKTEIVPTVLVIYPSGYTEFLDADVKSMSSREMASLIDADNLDAVHYSEPLAKITKKCGLKKNVAMYVDRNAVMNDLDDNAVGTMLYGHGYEVRGTIIIALEDDKYNTSSFETEEDIENVFEAIDDLTGLLRRETDDDGRYDPWA